jgi:hypothetical protein
MMNNYLECVQMYPGVCTDVSRSVYRCILECVQMYPGVCTGVSWSVYRCIPECVQVYPGVCTDVSRSVYRCILECVQMYPALSGICVYSNSLLRNPSGYRRWPFCQPLNRQILVKPTSSTVRLGMCDP